MMTNSSTYAIERRARQMRAEFVAGLMRNLWARLSRTPLRARPA